MTVSRADRHVLLAGAGVLAVLMVAALFVAPTSGRDQPTSYSASSSGFKAAFLLTQELGYRADRWDRAPAELADPELTTLVVADPIVMEPPDGEALLRFVEAGGRVVVTGQIGAALVGLTARTDVTLRAWQPATAVALSPITRAAPVITLNPATVLEPAADTRPLYTLNDKPAVVHLRRQKGEIFWWAAATPLSNAGITATGNLAFVLASLGRPGERHVLFDEYFHGYRHTLAQSLMLTPVKWLLVQLALLAVIVVATYARRSGPILAGVSPTRLSPLEFVRTMSELYRRARAGTIPVRVAYARFRADLTARFGIPTSLNAGAAAAALARCAPVDVTTLAATLRACEAMEPHARVSDREALAIVQTLHDRTKALDVTKTRRETR